MSTAQVELRLPGGQRVLVPAGGIVGRLAWAHARIVDSRVSEAHALVVLRGRALRMLALRGLLEVDGQRPPEATLAPAMRIRLAEGVEVVVEEVHLPGEVLALVVNGALVELGASDLSVVPGPPAEVVPRYVPGAPVHVLSTGAGWDIVRAGRSEAIAKGGGVVRRRDRDPRDRPAARRSGKRPDRDGRPGTGLFSEKTGGLRHLYVCVDEGTGATRRTSGESERLVCHLRSSRFVRLLSQWHS